MSAAIETVLYSIPSPYDGRFRVEVYGEPDMGWYEWRMVGADGRTQRDSKDRGYGSPEIALRDALVEASA